MLIQPNDTVLFQGDSITDCNRDRDLAEANHPHALGRGYACFAAAMLLGDQPQMNLRIYNRGISGNVVQQMLDRWQADCLDIKPSLLSILLGINDTARPVQNQPDADTVENFDLKYRRCIDAAQQVNPKLRLVLCEPFALQCGNVTEAWKPGLEARQQIVRKLAVDYDAVFVPFQSLFDEMATQAPDTYWLPDGVHPNHGAHMRMARMWIDHVNNE